MPFNLGIRKAFKGAGERIRKYQADAPDREAKQLASLKRQTAIEQERTKIARAQQIRRKLTETRGGFGGGFSPGLGLSGGGLYGQPPPAPRKKRTRKTSPKKKRKGRKVVMYV